MARHLSAKPLAADLVVELAAYDSHRTPEHRLADCADHPAHTIAVKALAAAHDGDFDEIDRVRLPDGSIACWHLGRFGKGVWTSEPAGTRCLFHGSRP